MANETRLITLAEWRRLKPDLQGYALYMQADLPNSELRGQHNPYEQDTDAYLAFCEGERRAVLAAQDSEE